MDEKILVTGGTGVLGRVVVRKLLDAGHGVRVMSRGARPAGADERCGWATANLRTGDGVADAAAGVGVIVHCATDMSRAKEVEIARTLVNAAKRAGSPFPHLVAVSIVGIDRVPLGYYRGKLEGERLIEDSGLPFTILRAAQFHDLVRTMLAAAAKSPVMPVPAMSFQPIDARDVADRLIELALAEPLGHAPDIAGPEVRDTRSLARAYLTATGRRSAVVPVWLPGKAFHALRQGANLVPGNAVDGITFDEYLAGHTALRSTSYRGLR